MNKKQRPTGIPAWESPSFDRVPITSFSEVTSMSSSSSSSHVDFPTSVSSSYSSPSSSSPISPTFFRTPYNFDTSSSSLESSLECLDVSLTRQDDADQADINFIVNQFLKTGELPQDVRVPQYGDFSDATDYKTSLDLVRRAEQAFGEFPADVRARFNHDVGAFLDAAYKGDVEGVTLSPAGSSSESPTPPNGGGSDVTK